jgi:hypothetical protein
MVPRAPRVLYPAMSELKQNLPRPCCWTLLALGAIAACAGTAKPPAQTAGGAAAARASGPEAGPPVALVPAPIARTFMLASISIGSFDRTLDNGVRLVGSAVPLPMTATGVRDWLFSEVGLSPEVAANLDSAAPIGGVVMALEGKRTSLVLAVAARGPAEAERLVDALGKRVMTRGVLTLVSTGGKSQSWVYREGSVVVLGDEIDGMMRGAMLAIQARHPSPDDVTATLFPDAIARANGTDVKTGIATLIEQVRQAQQMGAAAAEISPQDNAASYETLAQMLALVGDSESVDVGLSLDPARGLVLRGRLFARPGTALQAGARDVHPFEIDPAVLTASGAPFMVGGMSMGSVWAQVLNRYRARLAAESGKGAAAAVAYYDAFLSAMAGQQSGSISVGTEVSIVSGVFSTPLKDAAAAAKVAAALSKLDAKAMDAVVHSQVRELSKMFDWTATRESVGKVKALRFRLTLRKGSPYDSDVIRRVIGKGIDAYQGVAGTRLILTFGRDARAQLAAIATGKVPAGAKAAAALTDAQAAAKGRDAFYYLDFTPLLRTLGQFGDNPRLAAVARSASAPLPLVFTSGGDGAGKVWTLDATLPPAAFSSIGALVTSGMMSGGK